MIISRVLQFWEWDNFFWRWSLHASIVGPLPASQEWRWGGFFLGVVYVSRTCAGCGVCAGRSGSGRWRNLRVRGKKQGWSFGSDYLGRVVEVGRENSMLLGVSRVIRFLGRVRASKRRVRVIRITGAAWAVNYNWRIESSIFGMSLGTRQYEH